MTAKSNPGDDQSTHDLILTNGSTSIGLIICDSKGQRNPLAFAPQPMNRNTLKMYQGTQKYADLEPPWTPVGQTDWSGGRGSKDFDKDASMYYDGYQVNTCRPGEIILGPKATELALITTMSNAISASRIDYILLDSAPDAATYIVGFRFTSTVAITATNSITVGIKRDESVNNATIQVGLAAVSSGAPGAITLSSTAINVTDIPLYVRTYYNFTLASTFNIDGTSDYFLVFKLTNIDTTPTGFYKLYYSASTSTLAAGDVKESWDGGANYTTKTSNTYEPYFIMYAADTLCKRHFFEYKGALYAVGKNDSATSSKLYLNGDHGVIKTGSTTTSIISNTNVATWGANDANCVGSILKIVSGTGVNQPQPWRVITANTAVNDPAAGNYTFTVSPAFDVAPAANDIFAIVSSNEWTEVAGFDTSYNVDVTDVLVANGTIYCACGDSTAMVAVRAFNSSGTWTYTYSGVTTDVAAETGQFTFLDMASDAEGTYIWGAKNGYPSTIAYAPVVDNTGFTGTNETVLTFGSAVNIGDLGERITGLEVYGDYGNLHVFKEGSLWQIVDKKPYRIDIREMANTLDYRNGMAHCVHGVYLYSSWHDTVTRYYDGQLDTIGPNKADVAWPSSDRAGNFSCLVGYPGLVFGSVDAGSTATGISTILAYNGLGWCELYTGTAGKRIQNMYIQSIPGNMVDRLWFDESANIKWLPVSLDPYNHPDTSYNFATTGYLITSWIYLGLQEVDKFFNSLKLVIENTTADEEEVQVEYQLDNDTSWTEIYGDMATYAFDSFSEEIDLATTPSKSGKRIRFRFTLISHDGAETPRVVASVLEAVTRIPTKYYYAMTVALEDKSSTRQGAAYDMTTALAKFNTLTTLQALATPCLVESDIDMFDGKYMWVDSVSPRPINVNDGGGKKALYVCNMTLIEA